MRDQLNKREYAILSSMLFGLFFGAGNLIFPVHMGQMAGNHFIPAVIGFCITGVGMPLLGIAAMGISASEGLFDMSGKVGRAFGYFFTCALYLSIGPLFAIPRTATVSFQVGVSSFVPEGQQRTALLIFSLLFFLALLYFALRPSGIMTWVGKILNPLFLILLAVILLMVVIRPMGQVSGVMPSGDYVTQSFSTGFLEGYNTMDALASLAFGIVLITSIRSLGVTQPGKVAKVTVKAGVFAVALMALIYAVLTYAGAQSAGRLEIAPDGGIALYQIADYYFGTAGAVLLGVTITFACLKTAVGLVTACSETFAGLFPRVGSYRQFAIGFTLVSFLVANFGLSRIIAFSIPALTFLYPLTITLIILCLAGRYFHYDRRVFLWAMTLTTVAALFEFASALPKPVQAVLPLWTALHSGYGHLPLSHLGMGWILPALAGTVIGLIHTGLDRAGR